MVKLSDSKGKSGEGFVRLFGSDEMGILFSKVQSSVIRSGFELEEMLIDAVSPEIITTLDDLRDDATDFSTRLPTQVVFKPSKPDPDNPSKSIQADLLIVDNEDRRFWLVEIKEGYVFDTKKADGELASLKNITSWLAQEFAYRTQYYLCSFNQHNKEAIVNGTKKRFSIEHVMTGQELCTKINIDYNELREVRQQNQAENRRYFLSELLAISDVRDDIMDLLSS